MGEKRRVIIDEDIKIKVKKKKKKKLFIINRGKFF